MALSILPKLNNHYESGIKYYNDNHLYEAISEFKNIVDGGYPISGNENNDINKLRSKTHFYLGKIYKCQNRLKDAISQFSFIYDGDENYLNARLEIVKLYTKLYEETGSGSYKRSALSACESILWKYPDCFEAHFYTAELIRFDTEEVDKTYKEFKIAVSLNPQSMEARLSFIEFLSDNEEYNEVIKQAYEILTIDEANSEAYFWLSEAFLRSGEVKNAIKEIQRAIELDSSSPKYHNQYGHILKSDSDMDNALSEFRKACELGPTEYYCGINLIDALIEIGEYDEAIMECNLIKKNIPMRYYIYIKCGEIYEKIGQWNDAILEYLEVLDQHPDFERAKEKLRSAKEKLRHISKKGKVYSLSDADDEFLTEYQLGKKLKSLIESTEKDLRILISEAMFNSYGVNWVSVLESKNGTIKKMFDNCREKQQREYTSFGDKSKDLLDYTYPADLFTLIFIEWDIFKNIFGVGSADKTEKKYWSKHADLLPKVRTPTAHNRQIRLAKHEKIIAIAYCEELNGVIKKYIT